MALYDGFFDAVLDENTLQYDRTYNSGDFTGYFGEFVGSGVCIHENEDSFKVSWNGAAAEIAIGYLWIQGFWARIKDDPYVVPFSGQGVHAVLAWLNMGAKRIEVGSRPKADPEVYPDALVLAYVTIDSAGTATVEDTRYNTDICGVIDSAGGLSDKVEYAIHYIDNEIEDRLSQIEEDLEVQAATLDAKIAEVDAMVEKLAPPPIGTIRFSASQDIEEGWLRCDGSFINEADYPELVAALGKHYPSGDKFKILSKGDIGANITNAVLFNSRLWVYSWAEKKLYGVSVDSEDVKIIPVTSDESSFTHLANPNGSFPLALSITSAVTTNLFLCQVISVADTSRTPIILASEFTGEEENLVLAQPFGNATTTGTSVSVTPGDVIPYVVAKEVEGVETFYCAINHGLGTYLQYLSWTKDSVGQEIPYRSQMITTVTYEHTALADGYFSKYSYNPKNQGELVFVRHSQGSGGSGKALVAIESIPEGIYGSGELEKVSVPTQVVTDATLPDTPIIGESELLIKALYDNSSKAFTAYSLVRDATEFGKATKVTNISFPVASRLFPDAISYLWGKGIWLFFMGSGLLFTRSLTTTAQYGFLNTLDVLGTITQFGYLYHSSDENTLYLVGQDSANQVVVAAMKLNTLFDYATDGAWLPSIASDGIPAYIKAKEPAEGA